MENTNVKKQERRGTKAGRGNLGLPAQGHTHYELLDVSFQSHVWQVRHHVSHHFETAVFGQVE